MDILRLDINLVLEILNVLILFGILTFFLYKPIQNILQKRKEEIEQGYQEAENMRNEAEQSRLTYEKALKEAREESRQIVANAKLQAKAEYDKIIADANAQAELIMKRARENVALERENAMHSLEAEMAEMVITATKKVVGHSNTALIDSNLYDDFLAEAGEHHES